MGRALRAALGVLVCFAAACAHTVSVRAPALLPARVPVRAFPAIWVAGGEGPEDKYLLDRLATHLARDGEREVRRVDLADLEPAREAGRIETFTAVVLLESTFDDALRRYWDSSPVQYCGYYGCTTNYQSSLVTVVEVTGKVELTIYEGPTARVLQREHFELSVGGEDVEGERAQVLDLLATELEHAVDVLKVRERIQLQKVKMPEVEDALEKIEQGHWDAGRSRLEDAAKRLGGKDKSTQAKVWYDLGIARWFAPGREGLTHGAYEAAARALRWANRCETSPAYRLALAKLVQARDRFILLEQQRAATAYNFAAFKRSKVEGAAAPEAVPQAPPAGEIPAAPAPAGSPDGAP